MVILPNAQSEFLNLRYQDFKTGNCDIPSGYTIGNTHLDCSDFFQDEDGEPVSNEAFNIMLGDPPTSV